MMKIIILINPQEDEIFSLFFFWKMRGYFQHHPHNHIVRRNANKTNQKEKEIYMKQENLSFLWFW